MRGVTIIVPGQGVLSPAAIAASEDATRLVDQLRRYDDALVRHGAPDAMRIPEEFRVEVFSRQPDVGTGGDDRIALSTVAEDFREPTMRIPDVIAHELTHGSIARAHLPLDVTNEGWPDAVARAVAIEAGDDVAARPWSMVRDGYRATPDEPWGDMRDPLTARRSTVADLDLRNRLLRDYETSRFGDAERRALEDYLGRPLSKVMRGYHGISMLRRSHAEAALVTKPAAIASATLGPKLVAGAYLDAFANLRGHIAAARDDIARANDAGSPLEYQVMGTAQYAELLGSARATIEALRSTGPAGADDVMRGAWADVGVRVETS